MEYIELEDRLRLAGEGGDGAVTQGWLTQRLVGRLLPHLLAWLERQPIDVGTSAAPAALAPAQNAMLQGFVQQAARAELAPQEPVRAQQVAPPWLVHAVDLTGAPQRLVLTFRGQDAGEQCCFGFTAQSLRQWLGIVHDQYVLAGWPLAEWPQWIAGDAAAPGAPAALLH